MNDLTVETIEEFLKTRGCTLWGSARDIHSPAGRRRAAEWLFKELNAVADFLYADVK